MERLLCSGDFSGILTSGGLLDVLGDLVGDFFEEGATSLVAVEGKGRRLLSRRDLLTGFFSVVEELCSKESNKRSLSAGGSVLLSFSTALPWRRESNKSSLSTFFLAFLVGRYLPLGIVGAFEDLLESTVDFLVLGSALVDS